MARSQRFQVIMATLLTLMVPAVAQGQVDILGAWVRSNHENYNGDATVGDYSGLPINEAARVRADSWTAEPASSERSTGAGDVIGVAAPLAALALGGISVGRMAIARLGGRRD